MKIYGVKMEVLKASKAKVILVSPNGAEMEMDREEYEDRLTW